jgi:hypothetical protein
MHVWKPEFVYALSNQPDHKFRMAADAPVSPGDHVVGFGFTHDGGGAGKGAIRGRQSRR